MSSNVSTPNLEPWSTHTLAPPSPSPLGAHPPLTPLTALDDIPPLSLNVLKTHDDKVDGLKLIADSIAQQRQQAAFHLVFHPLLVGSLLVILSGVYQYAWVLRQHDLGTTLTLGSGVVMTYLLGIRYFVSGYIRAAEELSWDWLVGDDEEDVVIGTRFGGDLVGALVLRLVPSNPSAPATSKRGSKNSHHRGPALRGGRGVIRAWTTKLRYRHRGVGGDMLREAVRVTRDKCGRDAEIGFALEHANSVMVLPELFNKPFRKGEIKAARALEAVVSECDKRKR
ncbi:hypothetical protein B0T24DRAFT_630929 [Lasiosphaeria ovina]|uniref:Uncharacterized protein n=1 Tax=Lasiosphaeria ovina TaxID=92902 RepID=A0AAE0N2V8_9PEZI|nr:hypothetical protein B0T24DRAFT_630929 [Lasiosphaeria ovina]